jgi:hypothetical protein
MAKTYSSEDLAKRAFLLSMALIGTFITAVFLFVL